MDSEAENRKKKILEMNILIAERKNEMERFEMGFKCRLTIEHENLLKNEREQKELIEKLTNNEV